LPPNFKCVALNYFREFLLPIGGLSVGIQPYSFDIGREFFALTEASEISDGRVKVALELSKQEGMIALNFVISGEVVVACDRCLDDCPMHIEGEYRLILKYGDHFEEESDEVLIIPLDQHQFDISRLLYEYIILLIPMKRVHADDAHGHPTCNKEVLKRLEELRAPAEPDPRWEVLKQIKTD
jgi:uncharacterized protein